MNTTPHTLPHIAGRTLGPAQRYFSPSDRTLAPTQRFYAPAQRCLVSAAPAGPIAGPGVGRLRLT